MFGSLNKYFDGKIVNRNTHNELDDKFIESIDKLKEKCDLLTDNLQISKVLEEIFEVLRSSNKYIDETTPWILAKEEDNSRLKTVIYNLLESIRIGSVMLTPFLTQTSENIFKQLNTDVTSFESIKEFGQLVVGKELNDPEPLFVRIDRDSKLEEISNFNSKSE